MPATTSSSRGAVGTTYAPAWVNLGKLYSQRHGLEFVGLRIGWIVEADTPLVSAEDRGWRALVSASASVATARPQMHLVGSASVYG